ncbi:MAG: metalloregulator ArsR/SmtB family transcription factor [Candidatus Omnitrophica bacterium]|nr:metalloregulator ArsR/SmtB family transcription factor [Candidatus Omnitrophota bacterium]
MNLKTLRQLLKVCADDKRLRIINALSNRELVVKDICSLIKSTQPTVSKHLANLRMLRVVVDRREGNLVYYRLNNNPDSPQRQLVDFIVSQFSQLVVFQEDKKEVRNRGRRKKI